MTNRLAGQAAAKHRVERVSRLKVSALFVTYAVFELLLIGLVVRGRYAEDQGTHVDLGTLLFATTAIAAFILWVVLLLRFGRSATHGSSATDR